MIPSHPQPSLPARLGGGDGAEGMMCMWNGTSLVLGQRSRSLLLPSLSLPLSLPSCCSLALHSLPFPCSVLLSLPFPPFPPSSLALALILALTLAKSIVQQPRSLGTLPTPAGLNTGRNTYQTTVTTNKQKTRAPHRRACHIRQTPTDWLVGCCVLP